MRAVLRHLGFSTATVPFTDGNKMRLHHLGAAMNKIFGPIRAPSPPRLPLPVPQHMAHPERGLIDVFPDGTRIAGRINRRMERRMITRG